MLRFAPSPTGDMHIQDLRIALFNYIIAKQKNEDLLIRIDDTNKKKNIEGKDKEILETLSFFSMDYKGVVYQSDNLKYHQKMAMQLMSQKKAFACFCSNEKLSELKDGYDGFCATLSDETVLNCNAPFSVRIKKPNEAVKFNDLFKDELSYKPSEVDSFIILDHDKLPTYNYACAIDDMLYDISTVIRDEKHLLNTAKQIHIRSQLSYDKELQYIHLPSIKQDEKELFSVRELIDNGFLPSAIANYLVILSTSSTPKKIFTLEDAVQWFDLNSLIADDVEFKLSELKQINKQYIQEMDELRLSKILGFADSDIGKLAKLFLEKCSTIKEIKENVDLIFSTKALSTDHDAISVCIKSAPYFEEYKDFKNHIIQNTKLDEILVEESLKMILVGQKDGPEPQEVYLMIKNYLGEIVK